MGEGAQDIDLAILTALLKGQGHYSILCICIFNWHEIFGVDGNFDDDLY